MTALPLSSRNRVYGDYPAFQLGCPPSKTPSQERPPTAKRGDRWLHSALIEQRRVVEILAAGRAADPIVAQYILNRYAIKRLCRLQAKAPRSRLQVQLGLERSDVPV